MVWPSWESAVWRREAEAVMELGGVVTEGWSVEGDLRRPFFWVPLTPGCSLAGGGWNVSTVRQRHLRCRENLSHCFTTIICARRSDSSRTFRRHLGFFNKSILLLLSRRDE